MLECEAKIEDRLGVVDVDRASDGMSDDFAGFRNSTSSPADGSASVTPTPRTGGGIELTPRIRIGR